MKNLRINLSGFTSKDTALFLFFVVMATVFWFMLTFNTQMTHDVTVNLSVKKPANVTLLQELPSTITITVKDRGTTFLRYYFRSTPTIELDFNRYCNEKGHSMVVSATQLTSEVRRTLRREASIIKVLPETINVKYTTLPGKKVPVNWEDNITNVTADRQFVISPEDIKTSPDSVMVYAIDRATLHSITEVDISQVEVEDLKANLDKNVRIKVPTNVRVIPSKVSLHVPVEPLIRKEQMVPVAVRNQPYGINVLLFPTTVKVSYLLPQSKYQTPMTLTVVVDYNDIDLSTNKVNIKLGEVPGTFHNVTLDVDSVNYVIERY